MKRWHMKLVICVQLAYVSVCLTQLSVVREWTSLDVQLPPVYGQEARRRSIMPSEIKSWLLYKDRVFITLHREWEYSLAYLDLTDNSTSPLLRPYPSYEKQQMLNEVDRVRVDRCDRLWVNSIMHERRKNMIVFDLKTDNILRNSSYPDRVYSFDMTVDDFDCDNEYVYISNFKEVWTYSWAEDDSWRHITNIIDPINSMILAPNSIVYYNVGFESMVYYMSTTHLRDKSNKTYDVRELGRSRKLNVNYLALSTLHAKSDVLYYFNYNNRTKIHVVPCWTSERCSSNCQDVSIDPTQYELDYITVDENDYLWAMTIRSSFEDGEINFRLLSVPVKSTCVESNANDTTNTSTDVEPNAKDTTNTTNINESTTAASSATEQTSTLGSVPKHTTVNITDTTAGTPNSNIKAVGGTNMPYLLFSFANVTFNLSNFTIRYGTNFTNNYFH